ncbi:type VI secretion system baseplate subunit TssK [Dysgonomonas sp. 511]|uniref:type VI secretion system baseplate subunit TssK n=1 Tax=Dysgonomonas sp. 511 TaxID=2302930 RepID=UPI0013D6B01B|nr:type VI secretion system baseplate subunit TssK [Dysgonomonas sp. 511]NDV78481.1 type VI secretion system membrane-associated complex protein TssK [Dysgonomonas sp. 511]
MSNKMEYKRVNWTEGMDVRFDLFEQTENYFTNFICQSSAIQLNKNNFGLLPSADRKANSSEFDISERVTGTVEIKLRKCNAIMIGGCRINYNPSFGEAMEYVHTFDANTKENLSDTVYWDVIITADPYRRVPSGMPDASETPPRHPDVSTYYGLSIVPKGELNTELLGTYHLVIGRIRHFGERYVVDSNFIPPCTSMASHTDLTRYFEQFGSLMNDIENASKVIIAKIRNRSQNSTIATHIGTMCEDMMRYIASVYFNYRNVGLDATPITIVNYFSTLAHICYINMNFINKIEKEELLRYFYEWSDVKPGSFEELLSNTLGIIYDHNNIRAMMMQVETFLRIISELWIKLSSLEYIGQHKENIVIGERSNSHEIVKKVGGWTILD